MGNTKTKEDISNEILQNIVEEDEKKEVTGGLFGRKKKKVRIMTNLEKLQSHISNIQEEDPEYKLDKFLFCLEAISKVKIVLYEIEKKGNEKNEELEEMIERITNYIIVDDREEYNKELQEFQKKFVL